MTLYSSTLCTDIRQYLRVLHCLQKERGISIVYTFFSSSGSTLGPDFNYIHKVGGTSWCARARASLENARAATDSALDGSISSLNNLVPSTTGSSPPIQASFLVGAVKNIRTTVDLFAVGEHSSNEGGGGIQDRGHRLRDLLLVFNEFITQFLDNFISNTIANCLRQLGFQDLTTAVISMEKVNTENVIAFDGSDHKRRSVYLLSLINHLASLKESTGKERAALAGLLSFDEAYTLRDDSIHQSPIIAILFNNLIFEEANQRMILKQLRGINEMPGYDEIGKSLMRLVDKSIYMPLEMEKVQEQIRTSFAVEGIHQIMSLDQFWTLITLYIDQLHAVELLLVEELQSALSSCVRLSQSQNHLPAKGTETSLMRRMSFEMTLEAPTDEMAAPSLSECELLLQFLRNPRSETARDAMSRLLSLSPEHVKAALTDYIGLEKDVMNPTFMDKEPTTMSELPLPRPQYRKDAWHIDVSDVKFLKRIGAGAAGTTYLAHWSGQEVAVKVACVTDSGLESWLTEVETLRQLHHTNVIRLLGTIYNTSPQAYGLVLEFCDSGDLSNALSDWTPPNFFFRVSMDVANGVNYLHKRSLLHRDIKPGNILISGDIRKGNFSAKVSDFGLAVLHKSPKKEEHTAETGTYRYMPPEVIRHEKYSFQADVYSYALVLWQLITHEEPFQGRSQVEAAGLVALEQARPPLPPCIPNELKFLIEESWSDCPENRPSFQEIIDKLQNFSESLSSEQATWLGSSCGHPVYAVKAEAEMMAISQPLQDHASKRKRRLSAVWNLISRAANKG